MTSASRSNWDDVPDSARASALSARTTLTEDQIVEAALQVIRADGLDALSMRRLSRGLGVSPMAAYHYVANKQELLDLVAAKALADIMVPDAPGLAWHVRLRILVDRINTELRHHRGVGEVLLDRMQSTQRHIMRGMMELFAGAGFDDAGVVMAYATVHTYLFGRYRVTMVGTSGAGEADETGEDIVTRVRPVVERLRGRDYYEFGVETMIAGLRAQLRHHRRAARLAGDEMKGDTP